MDKETETKTDVEIEPPENTIVIVSNLHSLEDGLCNICVEKPNKQRPFIQCPCCDYRACSRCIRTYLLSIPTPKCMNCAEVWTRPFLFKQFPVVFHRELKIKSIQTKYEREIAMLPLAQTILDHEKKKKELSQSIDNVQDRITELISKLNSAKLEKARLVRDLYLYETKYTREQNMYVRPCPNGSCRGFLNTAWKCGICEKDVCSQCHEIKEKKEGDLEHVCNEDTLKTAKMIKTDSRPCPKCHAYIFKIDGCNQLWCVNCHTAFNWNTGCIIKDTRYFHNPHYFDWMKTQNTQNNSQGSLNETECVVREIDSTFIIFFNQRIKPLSKLHTVAYDKLAFFINEKCRKIVELNSEIMPKMVITVEKENEDLRLDYLKNKIDKKRFYDILSRRYTLQESKKEYGQVLSLFINSFTDITFRLRREMAEFIEGLEMVPPDKTTIRTRLQKINSLELQPYCPLTETEKNRLDNQLLTPFFFEIENLRLYTNECLTEIRKSFGLKREYYIDEERLDWRHRLASL